MGGAEEDEGGVVDIQREEDVAGAAGAAEEEEIVGRSEMFNDNVGNVPIVDTAASDQLNRPQERGWSLFVLFL